MANIRRRKPKGANISTKISIPNILSVSRLAPVKRQPYEVEELDNVLISLERNVEKRAGFTVIPQDTIGAATYANGWDFSSNNTKPELFQLSSLTPANLWYYWYNINEDTRFLIVVDFSASTKDSQLFYMYQLLTTNQWKNVSSSTQWDPTDPTIASSTVGSTNSTVVQAYATANSKTYAEALALGTLKRDSRNYITYNPSSKTPRESLKAVTLGSNVIILNTNVYAGFSSDVAGFQFGLDGVVTGTVDTAGRKLTYYSAAKASKVYDVGADNAAGGGDDVFLGYVPDTVNGKYIDVSDYTYYKAGLAYLGQKVNDVSAIKLPPQSDDWYSTNTNVTLTDTKASAMLALLYDSTHPFSTVVAGRGKIYQTLYPFLNLSSGYYRVISFAESEIYGFSTTSIAVTALVVGQSYKILTVGTTTTWASVGLSGTAAVGSTFTATAVGTGNGTVTAAYAGVGYPYLQKIRTPDEHSYIDPRRMPQRLVVTIVGTTPTVAVESMKWKPRESGTKDTNPGPSIFKTISGKALKQVRIKSLSVFKDRLWFSADDIIFSSQLGEYESLFIDDPANIVDTDPIDIRSSSNTYAEIVSMSPFEDYLFVDTKANIQFQLTAGSDISILSPTNVIVSPVTYYSTTPIIEPQTIGSQLYFFDAGRLYLYLGKDKLGLAKAVDVSASIPGYLPRNYKVACTAPSQDSIVCVDADNLNHIYVFTVRFSGDRVVQSSFYRFVLDTDSAIQTIQAYEDSLYVIIKNLSKNVFYLQKTDMSTVAVDIPRLDDMFIFRTKVGGTNPNTSYDSTTDVTTFKVPTSLPYVTEQSLLVFGPKDGSTNSWDDGSLETLGIVVLCGIATVGNHTALTVLGNYSSDDYTVYIGNPFEMNITLGTLFLRDVNGQVVDGTLNIKTGVIRHNKSGPYTISVSSRFRTALESTFYPNYADLVLDEGSLPLSTVDNQGEFTFKVFGYSEITVISIIDSSVTPVNIVGLDFRGKFKQKSNVIDH